MALITKQTVRVVPPHEPESWFAIRALSAGDLEAMGEDKNMAQVKLHGVAIALQEWSYPVPLTKESLRDMDVVTFNWLTEQVFEGSTGTDAEKNASSSSSSASTGQGAELSQPSSGI